MNAIFSKESVKNIHKHPFQTFIPQNATKLILGSIPPAQFTVESGKLRDGDLEFYYGSRDNALWSLLSEISGESLDTVDERKSFLAERGIAISDIVETCTRKNPSSDTGLRNIVYRDLSDVLKNPLTDIYCTSCWVLKRFTTHYINKGFVPKTIRVHLLPSPSPNYFRCAKRMKIFKAAAKKNPNLTPEQFRINCYRELLKM